MKKTHTDHVPGEVTCHEGEDTDSLFKIAKGEPVYVGAEHYSVYIRHHEDLSLCKN